MPLNVNFDAWGYITDWQLDTTNYGSYFTFLKPSNTILSWSGMVTNGYQSVNNDLDFSIAPWRINKKSAYIDIKGNVWFNNKNAVPSDAGKAYYNNFEILNEVKNAPFLLTRIVGSGTNFPPYDTKYWAYLINGETKSTDYISANYQITNFRYDKIKLCPYIVTTTKTMEDGVQTNIYSGAEPWNYIPSYSDIAGLYVVAVGFRIYAEINGAWSEKPLTITIPTYFSGDSSSNYFAGENGMKILRHPAIYTIGSSTHYNTMINPYPMSISIASNDITQGESHAIETCYSTIPPLSSTSTVSHGYISGTPEGFTYVERLTANAQTLSGCLYLKIDSEDVYNSFVDEVKKQLAYIGLPFVLKGSYSSESFDSDNVYLPIFDSQRCTTGLYKHGSDNATLDNYNWRWIYELPELPPDIEPDPSEHDEDYGDKTNQGGARGLFPAGVNLYLMSRSDYNIFMSELNSYYQNSTPDDWTIDFQGVNPSDYILAAYYTPYNFLKSDTKTAVKLGPLTLTTTAYELSQGSPPDDPNKWKYFTYGTRKVTPLFNDFRDYEPYTKVELYLPLAGTIELDTAYVMNHNITIEYYFDLMSLSGVAAVYRDNMLYKTSDFKLGCQVPVLSQNMGSIQNQITQLETAQKQNNIRMAASAGAVLASAGGALTGDVSSASNLMGGGGLVGIASTIINADQIDYNLKHTPATVAQTGTAEPMNNYCVGQLMPKLIIKRPLMLPDKNDTIYSHTIGNACIKNTTIGTMTGLIVCGNVDLSGISATAEEISAIQSILTSGAYA